MNINFIREVFPIEFLDYFEITSYEILCDVSSKTEYFQLYIDELLHSPAGVASLEYESKGFDRSKRIQDFPIRGKAVYLVIRTRLWRHKESGKIIKNNYSFVAQGAKLTQELSDFLKYASQY